MWGRQGQAVRAMWLLGAAESLRDALRVPRPPGERPEYEQRVAGVRTSLTDEAVASAWAEGQAMTLQQAIDRALEASGPV
jgi:hypothetical protein